MTLERFAPEHPIWGSFLTHLKRSNDARWVLDDEDQPKPDLHIFGVILDGEVIGHISIREQEIVSPATEWSEGKETPIVGSDGNALRETFVQTFTVEEANRRQGYGRALQEAALALTKELGCYQMRSWSSVDRPANYALKLGMGFAVHPAISESKSGQQIGGVYFVKSVD